jgi:phospholipase C
MVPRFAFRHARSLVLACSCLAAACSSDDSGKPKELLTHKDGGPDAASGAGGSGADAGSGAGGSGAGGSRADGSSDAGRARCRPDPSLEARRTACAFDKDAMPKDTIGDCSGASIPIEHVVLIVQENRSFDDYYGHLKGHGQDDVDVATPDTSVGGPPDAGAASIPWHHETHYCVEDTDHGWKASHEEWNNGKNDGFALANVTANDPTGQRAMGYYDQSDIPFYYDLISTFATSDRYFCSLLGPTYPNRMFLLGGTSFGIVTTDINVLAPPGSPNVLRALAAKGIDWKEYRTDLPGSAVFLDMFQDPAFANHFQKVEQFAVDAAAGTLAPVSIVDAAYLGAPDVESDEHPPANVQVGQHFVWEAVEALMHGPQWPTSALFFTYDEHGGLYDHVPPPAACAPDDTQPRLNPELGGFDRLGFRVPLIVVSPWAKRHFVSHTVHSHTSILRFLETKFELPAITKRDANSDALLDVFDFDSPPRLDVPNFTEPDVAADQLTACQNPSQ